MANRRDELNAIMKNLIGFHRTESEAFYKVALRKGATLEELAKELGVTKQALSNKYKHLKV